MARLEEIVPGAIVAGLAGSEPVTIIAATQIGSDALEVTWKTSRGEPGFCVLYREYAKPLTLNPKGLPWSFDADGADLRLASEAWRIHYAHLFDPYLAVHTSEVEPLPHQIAAVYREMLTRLPLRYVLADDPGAGKTIMTGLLIRELLCRGDLARCLIVCPGSLAQQWQDELYRKFHLRFDIMSTDRLESAVTGNAFEEAGLAIARLDKLARSDDLMAKLAVTDWDLIVCDEAHKMSASIFGHKLNMTRRFQLGKLLSGITRHFLLLTATPHNGKEDDFQLFLSLIDPDRFDVTRSGAKPVNVSDIMRRLVKEELLKFDGSPLFPDRQAITLNYDLSEDERTLYEAVTAYVQSEFNRADNLGKKLATNIGFALTVLQRRLASSPEAIYQSLARRRQRLQKRLEEEKKNLEEQNRPELPDDFDEDDLTAEELEAMENRITDQASAATTIPELEAEIATLGRLEDLAAKVRAGGTDRKWEELSGLLQEEERMFDGSGCREKLIIFTEHRDTLRYLAERIRCLLGSQEAVAAIYGGMSRDERRRVEESFRQDPEVRILIATDAAGEGINLQRSHLMVNYDLPWNPNRLEQRFGRIHRIGQDKICWLWNLVASQTREGAVFQRLFAKLEQERAALGGKVFDILGKVSFNNRPLRELLIEAVRTQAQDEDAAITKKIDAALDRDALLALLRENALTDDIMNAGMVAAMAEEMERIEARRLQPFYIEAFFREAFKRLGGKLAPREAGRFEITRVPAELRVRKLREPVLPRYQRVCFDKAYKKGAIEADLLCPGHPLLAAVIDLMAERHGEALRRGAILIDENDPGEDCRMLFYIESSLQDGATLPGGKHREISRQIHFVELMENGFSLSAGYAPYLDYRPANEEERRVFGKYARTQEWLGGDLEKRAISHAAEKLVPQHLGEVRRRKIALIDKTARAVEKRLTAEIRHWDYRASELREKENARGPDRGLNAAQAEKRAENLAVRRKRRMAELEDERRITPLPPIVTGGCLIVPAGLVRKVMGAGAAELSADCAARQKIEAAAMAQVMKIERELGFEPVDVSAEKRGFDIESRVPDDLRPEAGRFLRFLEVKGRAAGADTVTLTYNEMLYALHNREQFILAIVEVDGERCQTTYIRDPFRNPPDFSVQSSDFKIRSLMEAGEVIYRSASYADA